MIVLLLFTYCNSMILDTLIVNGKERYAGVRWDLPALTLSRSELLFAQAWETSAKPL